MAVRFLPPPSDEPSEKLGVDRENLAEVIEFRSKLREVSALDPREASPADAPARTAKPGDSAQPHGSGWSREPRQLRQPRRADALRADAWADGEASESEPSDTNVVSVSQARRGRVSSKAPANAFADAGGVATEELEDSSVELENVRTAMDDAVRMLARRARSSGELRRELVAKGHDPAEVDGVVLECESRLYLDDLGLARVVTENLRTRKRASRSQIRIKLRERLLPDGVIEEAIGELDQDEENDLLREAASERARKMGGLDRQTAERRLIGFLARRGWSGERAVRIAREALDRNEQRPGSSIGERRTNTLSAVPKPKSGSSSVRFQ